MGTVCIEDLVIEKY